MKVSPTKGLVVAIVYTCMYNTNMFLFQITEACEKAHLKYAIVGGYALALHGLIRATIDVDIVLSLRLNDFVLAEKVMADIGLTSRLPISAHDVITMRDEFIKNRNLLAWSFVDYKDPSRQVDILINTDLRKIETQKVSVGGKKVVVASLNELLKMKKASGRPQDLIDIKNIQVKINEKK